jgi:hypothetical protein
MRFESLNPRRARRLSPAALTTAGILSIGLFGGAFSAASTRHTHANTAKVVHVIEHAVNDTVVHSGGAGDVTGNTLTFHNPLYDSADAKQVGSDQGFCMRISPTDGTWECFLTAFVAQNQITVEGPFFDKQNSVFAITGGTGAYRHARGQMQLESRAGGSEYDFIYEINP